MPEFLVDRLEEEDVEEEEDVVVRAVRLDFQ